MAADLGCSSLNQSRVLMVVIYRLFKSEDGSAKEVLTMASEQSFNSAGLCQLVHTCCGPVCIIRTFLMGDCGA